ncbi:hypothetical protein GCM10009628_11400 [Paeniglutamicibacter kerguelensis]
MKQEYLKDLPRLRPTQVLGAKHLGSTTDLQCPKYLGAYTPAGTVLYPEYISVDIHFVAPQVPYPQNTDKPHNSVFGQLA